MAVKKGKQTRVRRKERKNIDRGQAHISSTFNNTPSIIFILYYLLNYYYV